MEKKNSLAFENASDYSELKKALQHRVMQLHNTDNNKINYICHYTNLRAAIAIIKNQEWYIGSPKKMNDGLELTCGNQSDWDRIFFASFMFEPQESIAMWCMYAQPWDDGVIIRIPVNEFKKWIKEANHVIQCADPITKKTIKNALPLRGDLNAYFVAYTNAWSMGKVDNEILICGTTSNKLIEDVLSASELTGYVKDMAWSYENEIRLRVDLKNNDHVEALSIDVPNHVINSMEIVTGPRFKGDIITRLKQDIEVSFDNKKVDSSLFSGKLNWVYCDSCKK